MVKYSINLLQQEIIPVKPFLTLEKVVAIWVFFLVIVAAISVFIDAQLAKISKEYDIHHKVTVEQTKDLQKLNKLIANQKPNVKLEHDVRMMAKLVANKKLLKKELASSDKEFGEGFSTILNDLATYHSPEVSLNRIFISDQYLSFSGEARVPSAVPAWLAKFKYSNVLSGKEFSQFQLTENQNNSTSFVVSTSSVFSVLPVSRK